MQWKQGTIHSKISRNDQKSEFECNPTIRIEQVTKKDKELWTVLAVDFQLYVFLPDAAEFGIDYLTNCRKPWPIFPSSVSNL